MLGRWGHIWSMICSLHFNENALLLCQYVLIVKLGNSIWGKCSLLSFLDAGVGAAQCLGELYRNFGRRIVSGLLETTNIVVKLLKFSEVFKFFLIK